MSDRQTGIIPVESDDESCATAQSQKLIVAADAAEPVGFAHLCTDSNVEVDGEDIECGIIRFLAFSPDRMETGQAILNYALQIFRAEGFTRADAFARGRTGPELKIEEHPVNLASRTRPFSTSSRSLLCVATSSPDRPPSSGETSPDDDEAFLINEAAVKALGWDNPIGKEFELLEGYMQKKGRVIGVVKDFNFRPLREAMKPLFMCVEYNRRILMLRIKAGNWESTHAHLEATWRQFHPNKPLKFRFMDEQLQGWYESEQKFGTLCGVFSLLAIVVAMLGIFGLMSYAIARRTREIGIRKALCATYRNIVTLFLLDLLIPVLTATAIASPVSWFASRTWLSDFAHRVDVNIPILLACIGLTALLCALVVITQTARPARANPSDALRQE